MFLVCGNEPIVVVGSKGRLSLLSCALILVVNLLLRFAVYLHGKAAEALVSTIGYNGVLATEVGLTARNLLNQLLYSSSEKS